MLLILVPTDFSKNSLNAITFALEFFKYQKVKFYFMHAYLNDLYEHKELVSNTEYEKTFELVKRQTDSQLEDLINTVKKLSPNPRFTYHSISANNTLVEEANHIVNTENIDLIVMGTKGKSDERHVVFGSHTFQVLKYVQCPVLAIPSHYKNTQPKHILFPTNYLIPYSRRELKLLSILAESYRSVIHVLYVSTSSKLSLRQEDNQAFIKDELDSNTVNFIHIKSKKISETIKTYISENHIEILTMVNTQHSFLEDMLFPSTIDKVSLNLKIPLLAMQNTRRY